MNSNARCIICESTDKWQNVDEFRHEPGGMCICMSCGFVTYPEYISNKDQILEHYRHSYRSPPNSRSIYSGERKLNFHRCFLKDLFNHWQESGRTKPVIGEIGAAFGMFLNWCKSEFKDSELSGTELTLSYRRVCWREYGIRLDEEFDYSKKYDLIAMYQVAEHIVDVDHELKKIASALKEDGLLYIGVPGWFGRLDNFGSDGFKFSYLYDKNHINVWTRKLFESLLHRCGFEIIKRDHAVNGHTYLCGKSQKVSAYKILHEDPAEILANLKDTKNASIAFENGRYEEAASLWTDFPLAYALRLERYLKENVNTLKPEDFTRIENEFIAPAMAACPDSLVITVVAAQVATAFNRFDMAMKYFLKAQEIVPDHPGVLFGLANCHLRTGPNQKDNLEGVSEYLDRFRQLYSESNSDLMNFIYEVFSEQPLPWENTK